MEFTGDELAGVVDLFGGLTRAELGRALEELAFKQGHDVGSDAFADDVDRACDRFRLVAVDPEADSEGTAAADETPDADEQPLLVPGPAAFPTLPEGATDLPHILDVEEREIDRERAGRAARSRLESAVETAIEAGDDEHIATLREVSYDLETWASIEADDLRERLDDAS